MDQKELDKKISQIAEESEKIMVSCPRAAHHFEHIKRVLKLGLEIGKEEGADMAILKPAILMHDLGRTCEDGKTHHSKFSVDVAKKVLEKVDYPKEYWGPILYAIENHSWRSTAERKEAQILQDADKLDAIGAIGLARGFAFGGSNNWPEYNPEDPFLKQDRPMENYTVDHIYWKILRLKRKMHTKKGKELAEEREKFVREFLDRMEKELNGEL
ncbi:MAG: HD domain-containing protein [Candidatus Aenigmarchaeota archaeon]|nr:HD domain-containing protein [Candidatus Aenigmarchaeota archaeon]